MILDRQNRLLVLPDTLGGDVANLDFQNLLLFYCQGDQTPPSCHRRWVANALPMPSGDAFAPRNL